jgi:thioredoxin-dependent peroxiredoxin
MKYVLAFLIILFAGCQPTVSQPTSSPTVSQSSATPSKTPELTMAPVLQVKDQDGNTVDFGKLYEQGPVVVYFYPKADTPGCTAQACSLRDAYAELSDKGIVVVGVSTDDAETQKAFKLKHDLPFVLIPDVEKKVLDAFQVDTLAGMSTRQAFLIMDGKIVWHDASASTTEQAQDVLAQFPESPGATPTPQE